MKLSKKRNILSMFIFIAMGIVFDRITSIMVSLVNIYTWYSNIIIFSPHILLGCIVMLILWRKVWVVEGSVTIRILKKLILSIIGALITYICFWISWALVYGYTMRNF